MNKTILLTAASVIALCAGGVLAAGLPLRSFSNANPFNDPHGAKLLYNQNSNDEGNAINSQNFSRTFSTYNDQAADDFVIPKAQTWKIREVDVTGVYFSGSGPATSENVVFYQDNNGMPGNPVTKGTFDSLKGSGGPNFTIILPGKGLKLNAGHYWVSVVANVDYVNAGEWGWEVNSVQHGNQAMWQNPNRGLGGCRTWGTIENCLGFGPDLMFDLRGTSKRN